MKFRKYDLVTQERSKDPRHTINIANIRDPNHGITKDMIQSYKQFSSSDIKNDNDWLEAPTSV